MNWQQLVHQAEQHLQLAEAVSLPAIPGVYTPTMRQQVIDVAPEINVNIPGQKQPSKQPSTGVASNATPASAPPAAAASQTTSNTQPAGNGDYVDFIKNAEGFAPKAVWDYAQHSIGYGTRGQPNETITPAQADARLRQELKSHEQRVDKYAAQNNMQLTSNQRAALISYDFNTGRVEGVFKRAGGDPNNISQAIRNGIKTANGQVLQGLVNRRNAEADLASKM